MSVLTYGMPTNNKLYCDNPVCPDYAEYIAKLPGDPEKEVCACAAHVGPLTDNLPLKRLIKLALPGERGQEAPNVVAPR